MTISSSTSRSDYIGNGSVSVYSYGFKVFSQDDLLVTVADTSGNETTLVINTDYTVSGVGDSGGGSVTLVNNSQAWLTSGNLKNAYPLTIRRKVDVIQNTDIRNQGSFYPEAHEDAFDYMTMIDQQQQDELDRSIKVAETDSAIGLLPNAASRANQYLAFDSNGDPIAAASVGAGTVSSFMQTVLDDTTAAAARTTLGFAGGLATNGSVDSAAIDSNAVTDVKLRDSAALSVIGRSANTSGDPADIAAASDGHVLRRSGTSIGFGTVATAGITDGAITRAKIASLGQQTANGTASPGQSTTSTSYVDITSCSVSLTTTGRPVFVGLKNTVAGYVEALDAAGPGAGGRIKILRDATVIGEYLFQSAHASSTNTTFRIPASSFWAIDTSVTAGTYTYKAQMQAISGDTVTVIEVGIIAFEIG